MKSFFTSSIFKRISQLFCDS